MIESIEFTNYKALRKTTLPLGPFTLLLGPNGSGKTSVLQALERIGSLAASGPNRGQNAARWFAADWSSLKSVDGAKAAAGVRIGLHLRWKGAHVVLEFLSQETSPKPPEVRVIFNDEWGKPLPENEIASLVEWLARIKTFTLDPTAIARTVQVGSGPLESNGFGLVSVLDQLKDNHRERWNALETEMGHWLPEYDEIQFEYPERGCKTIKLQTKNGKHTIPAQELSQGTLVSLALLTLAYLPEPPLVIGLEEIDRGLHPRLLRHLQDALYRLSYPESCGETRPAIQVVATTHSPYLLDLYRDHPEEVVLCQKAGLDVEMKRLSDIEHIQDILGDSPLSEVWYSGVLGGVSVKP